MSTARFFAPPREYIEIERQRDRLQVRNAELVLTLQRVQSWLKGEPVYRGKDMCIPPHGWDVVRKMVDEVLSFPAEQRQRGGVAGEAGASSAVARSVDHPTD